ncbi:transposase [Micromonospora sp. Llam0]|nr:transposase [Micromonospora sp. Llam0]
MQGLARRPKTAQALATRARIVLACAEGLSNSEVSRRLGVSLPTVGKWRKRFVADRVDGLRDEPRPGAPRKIGDAQVEAVITRTLEEPPSDRDSHWSTRSMAKAVGLNQTAVSRIWRAFGLKPHLVDSWKLSTDPLFVDKVRDIVGLYLDPPEAAMVLAVDEKSQMQALDRTAPMLPMMPGVPGRVTHDYVRHGTTSLFAALDVATGKVIGQTQRKHRHQEFLRFLRTIDRATPTLADRRQRHPKPTRHLAVGQAFRTRQHDPRPRRQRLRRLRPPSQPLQLPPSPQRSVPAAPASDHVHHPYQQSTNELTTQDTRRGFRLC